MNPTSSTMIGNRTITQASNLNRFFIRAWPWNWWIKWHARERWSPIQAFLRSAPMPHQCGQGCGITKQIKVTPVGRRESSPLTQATALRETSQFWLVTILIVTLPRGASVTARRRPPAAADCARVLAWRRCEPNWRVPVGAVATDFVRYCPSRSSVRSNRVADSGSFCCADLRRCKANGA